MIVSGPTSADRDNLSSRVPVESLELARQAERLIDGFVPSRRPAPEAMAVALLTTFYGAVLANIFFLPMVTKLERRVAIEVSQIELAIIGLDSMIRGDTSQILKEKLGAFLNQQEANAQEVMQAA